jgi:hypothetical protein
VERPLEDLLRALIGADPDADLNDKQRESIMFAFLGVMAEEKFEAVWRFADSISDESRRSYLLCELIQRVPPIYFRTAKRIADSIPVPYSRNRAVLEVASRLLEFAQAGRTNFELRNIALAFIREAETNIPLVAADDRSSIVWQAGLTLVKAGELDWAEKLADCSSYCPENTEVLLRAAKARAAKGEKDRAFQIARKVAELANAGSKQDLTNRPFDVLEVAEFFSELGEDIEARRHLDAALRLAIESDADGDIDAHKCIRLIAMRLAKEGDISTARDAASHIKHPVRRSNVLQEITEIAAKAEKT